MNLAPAANRTSTYHCLYHALLRLWKLSLASFSSQWFTSYANEKQKGELKLWKWLCYIHICLLRTPSQQAGTNRSTTHGAELSTGKREAQVLRSLLTIPKNNNHFSSRNLFPHSSEKATYNSSYYCSITYLGVHCKFDLISLTESIRYVNLKRRVNIQVHRHRSELKYILITSHMFSSESYFPLGEGKPASVL